MMGQGWMGGRRGGVGMLALTALTVAASLLTPLPVRADLDDDGYDDLIIGVPYEDVGLIADAGALEVLYGTAVGLDGADHQTLSQDGLQDTAEASDLFAQALTVGDFNGDGYGDVAVGVPGETVNGEAAAGAVNVIYGSVAGLGTTAAQFWTQDSPNVAGSAEADDHFGDAVVAGDFNGDGFDDLAIGVPGEDLGATIDNGAVQTLYGSQDGLTGEGRLWQQAEMGSATEADDRMGTTLAAGDFDGDGYDDVVIGTPAEDLEDPEIMAVTVDAGGLNVLYGSRQGLVYQSERTTWWHQDQPGMGETAETGDAFGAALAVGDFNNDRYADLAVGVPQEDLDGSALTDAGGVQILFGSSEGITVTDTQMWHQDVVGIADWAEAGDRFGSALAAGDFDGDTFDDLAVGVPQEDLVAEDIGVVHVIYGGVDGLAGFDQIWQQGKDGIANSADEGDHFGAALTAGDFNGDGSDDLAIGVPFEDVQGVPDAGAINVVYGSTAGITAAGDQFWYQGAGSTLSLRERGDHYGATLASYAGHGNSSRVALFIPFITRSDPTPPDRAHLTERP